LTPAHAEPSGVNRLLTLGIKPNISTAFHPHTDGQLEWTNQWVEQYLRFWVNHQQDNWHHYLPLAEFACKLWCNETTGQTPFKAIIGYKPGAEIFNITLLFPQWSYIWISGNGHERPLMI
jgi:hypothetical protein